MTALDERIFRVLDVFSEVTGHYVEVIGSLRSDDGPAPVFEMYGEVGEVSTIREGRAGGITRGAGARIVIGERITSGYKPDSGRYHKKSLNLKPAEITDISAGFSCLFVRFGELQVQISGDDDFIEALRRHGLLEGGED